MTIRIKVFTEKDEDYSEIDRYPDTCPICHQGIDPRIIHSYLDNLDDNHDIQIVFHCPRDECHKLFIGTYMLSPLGYFLSRLAPIVFFERIFSKEIQEVSENFITIFNEALQAEEMVLTQICGPGYRKALEFLIKDYAIRSESDENKKENIRNKHLGQVIEENISDNNVKTTAKLASWLGNDETHFVRFWEQMDIDDLKTLIEITVRWIESEEITNAYKKKMSEKSI